MKADEILQSNRDNYEALYEKEEAFLRYPVDWVIRFHNMYLRKALPENANVSSPKP